MQKVELRKGPWLDEEDEQLAAAIAVLGDRRWDALAKSSGLRRSGKSCRLRWMNYLRPNLKHGNISVEEEKIIVELHDKWGNKWSRIARRLPGRTDNEIKNYWRSHLRKKADHHNLVLGKECFISTSLRSADQCDSTTTTTTTTTTASPCSINDDQWTTFSVNITDHEISAGVVPSDDSSFDALEMLSLTRCSPAYDTRLTTEYWMSSNYDHLYNNNPEWTYSGSSHDDHWSNITWDFPLWDNIGC